MQLRWLSGVLSSDEIEQVLQASFTILEKTGVFVENRTILKRLAEFGGVVDWGQSCVRFHPDFLSDFLAATERFEWKERDISFSATAEIYQGWYLDPADGRYKEWTEQRLHDYIRLAKALPYIKRVSILGMPASDWSSHLQPLTEKLFGWKWGVGTGSAIWDISFCPAIYEMWNEWANATGRDVKQIFNGTVYLVSPLKFARTEAEQYVWFWEKGLEVNVGTLGSLGGTTPVTPAGALALQIAEGLFINILRRAFFGHSDLHLGNSLSVIDVTTGCFQYGRPEQTLLNIAGAQVARHLGALYGGHGGLTDAKMPGYEAAAQKVTSAIFNAFAYGHGHIAAGLLSIDEVFSPVQLVMDNELVGSLSRICKGFNTDEESLALDVIDKTGWGGEFLSSEHMALNMRAALWFPSIWSRESFNLWNERKEKNDSERAREQAIRLLNTVPELVPAMDDATEERLNRIINAFQM